MQKGLINVGLVAQWCGSRSSRGVALKRWMGDATLRGYRIDDIPITIFYPRLASCRVACGVGRDGRAAANTTSGLAGAVNNLVTSPGKPAPVILLRVFTVAVSVRTLPEPLNASEITRVGSECRAREPRCHSQGPPSATGFGRLHPPPCHPGPSPTGPEILCGDACGEIIRRGWGRRGLATLGDSPRDPLALVHPLRRTE